MIHLTIDKQRTPQKGDLLLSEPFLLDDHFTRSVIFLCEHNEEGSFGFILNNTLQLNLHEFAEGFPNVQVTVGFGGPVDQNQLFFIHTIDVLQEKIEIVPHVFMGGNYNNLLELLGEGSITTSDIRFFIGYTGWASGQLQKEIDEKTWIVTAVPKDFSIMRADDDSMWRDLLANMGGKYKVMADFPINPADN